MTKKNSQLFDGLMESLGEAHEIAAGLRLGVGGGTIKKKGLSKKEAKEFTDGQSPKKLPEKKKPKKKKK